MDNLFKSQKINEIIFNHLDISFSIILFSQYLKIIREKLRNFLEIF